MASICNQSEIKHPYYVEVLMSNITTRNKDTCWIHCKNSTSPLHDTTDLSLSISESESLTSGLAALFTSIPGTVLNFLVILAIMRSQTLRKEYLTPSVASIAITDLLFSIYVLPSIAHHQFKRLESWTGGCEVFGFFRFGLWMVSVFNLIGIAALRCFAINFPRKMKNKSFVLGCTVIPIMGWALTLILSLPILTRQYGRFGNICRYYVCAFVSIDIEDNPISPEPIEIYFMWLFFGGIFMVLLNIVSYVQVSKQSKGIFNQIKHWTKQTKFCKRKDNLERW